MKQHLIPMLGGTLVFLVLYWLMTSLLPSIDVSDTLKGALKLIVSIGGGIWMNNFLSKKLSA